MNGYGGQIYSSQQFQLINCLVRGCDAIKVKGVMNIHFHRLPTNIELRNKWLKLCDTHRQSGHICSQHFEPNAYERNIPLTFSIQGSCDSSAVIAVCRSGSPSSLF